MNSRKKRILIIEDEKKISDIVTLYLDKEGFTTYIASTGEEGLRLLRESPDLIILDLMLPDMPGEEVCRMIRETSNIPIIMLTAKSSEEDRIKGLGIGADDYVVKPFSPGELVARVKALLRRVGPFTKGFLSFNGGLLSIDTERFEARVRGRHVELTQTEFRILLALSERPGIVFTREQLINLVQGYDFEGYDRTIDAHIKNIRHKLEDDPRNPLFIKTVYGLGYKFTGQPDED
jgi:DNA-binding response OmpR family regulator